MGLISKAVINNRLKKLIHDLHGLEERFADFEWVLSGTEVKQEVKNIRGIRLPGPYPSISSRRMSLLL